MIASTHRPQDSVGNLISFDTPELQNELEQKFVRLPLIQTVISMNKRSLKKKSSDILVQLHAQLNEIGTLSLYCVACEYENKWKLEFRVRKNAPQAKEVSETSSSNASSEKASNVDHSKRDSARAILNLWYGKRSRTQSQDASHSGSLYKLLEKAWGQSRNQWELTWIRDMAEVLIEGESYRVRSMQHDLNWFKLIGFCMRPGFGASGDEWKMRQLEETLLQGPHKKERGAENEWWITCRRLSAGLSAQAQQALWTQYKSTLLNTPSKVKAGSSKKTKKKKKKAKSTFKPQALNELWRLISSFEHLAPSEKATIGDILIQRIASNNQESLGVEGWCLARLGSRNLLYADPVHAVRRIHVESWIKQLLQKLALNPKTSSQEYALVLTQLGEYTGDRNRDINAELKAQIISAIKMFDTEGLFQKTLTEGCPRDPNPENTDSSDNTLQQWTLGDTLPHGLKLISNSPAPKSKIT